MSEKEVQIGDIIKCQGRTAVISKIYNQFYEHGWYIEGEDQNGLYFYWKERFDGGRLIRKEDK